MFVYFIPLTVNLTKNSQLEKFVHELNALWKLSGSSMGAVRELVAVAGTWLFVEHFWLMGGACLNTVFRGVRSVSLNFCFL